MAGVTDRNILGYLHGTLNGSIYNWATNEGGSVSGYALEVESRRYPGQWSTLMIAGSESVYATLETARKRRSYLRQFDRRTWGPSGIRNSRIVKITVSREVVSS